MVIMSIRNLRKMIQLIQTNRKWAIQQILRRDTGEISNLFKDRSIVCRLVSIGSMLYRSIYHRLFIFIAISMVWKSGALIWTERKPLVSLAVDGDRIVFVGRDGVQYPPFHIKDKGGHLLAFLTCLETGLAPYAQLDPPLDYKKGEGSLSES